jgi:hypothetical protein
MLKLLNTRSDHFLSQLGRYECVLSARRLEGHRIPNNQTLVFVRDEKSRLPGSLVIAYNGQCNKHLPWKVDLDPLRSGKG